MEEKKSRKTQVVLSILGILSLILITSGVTYALFTYTKLGTTENTITTGTIKFVYTENTGVGSGISITNALPVTDDTGKAYNTDGYVFDFKVEGENTGTDAIPYEVTLRKAASSQLDENIIKVYLTDMNESADTAIQGPILYSNLAATKVAVGDGIVEKTLTTGEVPASTDGSKVTYEQNYRLRMWIDNDANFTGVPRVNDQGQPVLDDNGAQIIDYPYNGKSFTATVNVYSNVPTVTTGN